ncbi:Vacuolar protein sorting-associated protein 33B [Thelohanellus kitauei]|uniref:Vacuolar protein sorting-associated protein 33B n=1 Tax=Thelohanellus kitauei TaxID=669202 RepID=A0A0C2M152_THEKT|nr:Vacuolar protein sorting-associated protein 33B [Thelohanellus kitauei]
MLRTSIKDFSWKTVGQFLLGLRNCEFSDDINKSIEWQIVKQSDILSTLKLLCLWNCTRSGGSFLLSDKATKLQKSYRDMFLQSYGFEHLSTFYNLERSGFFTNFNPEEKNFKNAIPKTPPKNGPDISDVFSGMYRPFSSTLIEKIISNNFPKVDCSKFFASGIQSTVFGPDDKITEYAKNVTAVLYLGGLSEDLIQKIQLIIILLTTSVINGSDIMQMHTETI